MSYWTITALETICKLCENSQIKKGLRALGNNLERGNFVCSEIETDEKSSFN